MFYPTGTSGAVKTGESGRKGMRIWSDNYYVTTFELDNNGNERYPTLRRTIYLGDFSINETSNFSFSLLTIFTIIKRSNFINNDINIKILITKLIVIIIIIVIM